MRQRGNVGARTLAELGLCVPVCIYCMWAALVIFIAVVGGNGLLVRSFP